MKKRVLLKQLENGSTCPLTLFSCLSGANEFNRGTGVSAPYLHIFPPSDLLSFQLPGLQASQPLFQPLPNSAFRTPHSRASQLLGFFSSSHLPIFHFSLSAMFTRLNILSKSAKRIQPGNWRSVPPGIQAFLHFFQQHICKLKKLGASPKFIKLNKLGAPLV